MAIQDIKKAAEYSAAEYHAALRKLRRFLDSAEPSLVYFLTNLWRAQGKAITYKELREAILAGELSAEYLKDWQQDYNRFVVQHLLPAWDEAMKAATDELAAKYVDWNFNPMADGIKNWTETKSAEFVTNVTQAQHDGLRAVVKRAARLENRNVDSLARTVRSMVGLTRQQAEANFNYYENLLNNGVKEKKAQELAIRYAARQHRYRGYNIARTELAFAYNQGAYEGVKQAQAAGYMKDVVKIWCTAEDERTCEECGALEGKIVNMDDDFDIQTKLSKVRTPTIKKVPPAHPSCRCAVLFKEINLQNDSKSTAKR